MATRRKRKHYVTVTFEVKVFGPLLTDQEVVHAIRASLDGHVVNLPSDGHGHDGPTLETKLMY